MSLVLGTLIIVISIASQSTPKLIDLYTKDQVSLIYIWFLTAAAAHNLWLQLYVSGGGSARESSVLLNTYVLLPLGLILALPYIIYILRYTKPGNVIDKIYNENSKRINLLRHKAYFVLLNHKKMTERYQFRLFDSLNQLDDLLEYVSFKEPKGDIIHKIGLTVIEYIKIKKELNPKFFIISPKIKSDISFKTMTGQFDVVERTKTFYEQKAFRLIGNAYFKLIEKNDFDLASQCVFKLSECGKQAIECDDDDLTNTVIIRFNTILRFGIKHGLKNKEVRNIYNALFHYSEFIKHLIVHNKNDLIKQSCTFLKIYGTETYKHSRQEPSFTFLVDVFAMELKKALIELDKHNYSQEFQKGVLELLLELDNPPDFDRDELGQTRIINDGVRVLQVGLSLYYLSVDNHELVERIINDILEDYRLLGSDLKIAVDSTCKKLQIFTPTFWEDTDRGNANLYYVPEKDKIPRFKELFYEKYEKLPK